MVHVKTMLTLGFVSVIFYTVLYLFLFLIFQAPVVKPPEAAPKKPAAKATEKKGKIVDVEPERPLDPLAEKLRQQR